MIWYVLAIIGGIMIGYCLRDLLHREKTFGRLVIDTKDDSGTQLYLQLDEDPKELIKEKEVRFTTKIV